MNAQNDDEMVDFAVVIALAEELTAFSHNLNILLEPVSKDGRQYYLFKVDIGIARPLIGVVGFIGEMDIAAAQSLTEHLMDTFRPRLVASLGICGGISDEVKLGDVIVARDVENYVYRGKISGDSLIEESSFEDLEFGGKSLPTYEEIANIADSFSRSYPDIHTQWLSASETIFEGNVPVKTRQSLLDEKLLGKITCIHTGTEACGPFVVASPTFKEILQKHNRNYLTVDMESFGVVRARGRRNFQSHKIVVRGVSDFSDERKKTLDAIGGGGIRTWAMENASQVLIHLLRIWWPTNVAAVELNPLSLERGISASTEIVEALHDTIVNEYLVHPYQDETYIRRISYESFSSLFSYFLDRKVIRNNDLFMQVIRDMLSVSTGVGGGVQIKGAAGTGKTAFLNVLYWYLRDAFLNDPKAPLPVLINFHRYNKIITPRNHPQLDDEIRRKLEEHLKPLLIVHEARPEQQFCILIDGCDDSSRHRDLLSNSLDLLLRGFRHWRVLGVRSDPDEREGNDLHAVRNLSVSLILNPVSGNSPLLPELVRDFATVAELNEQDTQNFSQTVEQFRQASVDLFCLALFKQNNPLNNERSGVFSLLIYQFCLNFIQHSFAPGVHPATFLERAAALAYRQEIQPDASQLEERSSTNNEHFDINRLAQHHPQVSEYLTARHVVDAFVKIGQGKVTGSSVVKEANRLQYVYPYRYNRLGRELVNRAKDIRTSALLGIDKVLSHPRVHLHTKAHACYLVGRINYEPKRARAREILGNYRKKFESECERQAQAELSNQQLLVQRSLYISLAYLGDVKAQDNYVDMLLTDQKADEFNRGFHLEYYGDQDFDLNEPLQGKDKLEKFPKTFQQLFTRVQRQSNPIGQIEIQTLCSLAQHRHAHGLLSKEKRQKLLHLLTELEEKRQVTNGSLRPYLRMVQRHLQRENFRSGDAFFDCYGIKSVKRKGWVSRGLNDCESVADHQYGAYLLALMFLPDLPKWEECQYNKNRIEKMLLIHDLAEAFTDDLLPSERNQLAIRQEIEANEEIGMFGTYARFANTSEITTLFQEYEANQSTDAHVAQDIDKLENLAQLLDYKLRGILSDQVEEEFESWKQSLMNAVSTKRVKILCASSYSLMKRHPPLECQVKTI
jgi:5'-deoxynucleotidase YfbR-like HD superfamily hydrolase/nucleoside phosphorylase